MGNGLLPSIVRTQTPVYEDVLRYYFEIIIVEDTDHTDTFWRFGTMIGFADASAPLGRNCLGVTEHSVGYHGVDGKVFCDGYTGLEFGPTFGKGDVVGCGLDRLAGGQVFFTKNGKLVGLHIPPRGGCSSLSSSPLTAFPCDACLWVSIVA